jgi:hypothetical protein
MCVISNLICEAMARATEVLGPEAEARVKEVKSWLKSKGVRDFEPVSLFCDQLGKVRPMASHYHTMLTLKRLGNGSGD